MKVFSPSAKPPPPAAVRNAWAQAHEPASAEGARPAPSAPFWYDPPPPENAPPVQLAPPPWATLDAPASEAWAGPRTRRKPIPDAPNNPWATKRNPILQTPSAAAEPVLLPEESALNGAERRISRGNAPYVWAERRNPILDGERDTADKRIGVKRIEHTVRAPGPVGKAAPRPPPNMAGLPSGGQWGGRTQPALGAGTARPLDDQTEDLSRRHKMFTEHSHILQTVHDRDVLGQAGFHGMPTQSLRQNAAAGGHAARPGHSAYTPVHLQVSIATDGDAMLPTEFADDTVPRQLRDPVSRGAPGDHKPFEDHLVGVASLVNATIRDDPIPNRRGVGPPRNEEGVAVTSRRILGDVDNDFRPRGRDHHPEFLPSSDGASVLQYRYSNGICPPTRSTDDSKRRERKAVEAALYDRAAAYHRSRAGRIASAHSLKEALIAAHR